MAYNYLVEKQKIFTDEGQRKFTKFRDKVLEIVKLAGCIREQEASRHADMGDRWHVREPKPEDDGKFTFFEEALQQLVPLTDQQ